MSIFITLNLTDNGRNHLPGSACFATASCALRAPGQQVVRATRNRNRRAEIDGCQGGSNGIARTSAFPSTTWERGETLNSTDNGRSHLPGSACFATASCALRAPGQQVVRATRNRNRRAETDGCQGGGNGIARTSAFPSTTWERGEKLHSTNSYRFLHFGRNDKARNSPTSIHLSS
jgi:hypothetical protein